MTPRMFMDAQNYKQKLSPKVFVFVFFENARKNIIKSANVFCYCFEFYKEKITDRAIMKS